MKWRWFDIRKLEASEYEKYYGFLAQTKKERVGRYLFEDDRKRTVAGEMLARQMISKRCSVNESDIRFAIGEHGKPYALDLSIHYNISHSGNLVVCAVDKRPVGIDVEQIREIDLSVAKRICTENECKYIRADGEFEYLFGSSSQDVYKRFFEVWTMKEAYVKYVGTGITRLKEIDVLQDVDKKVCISIGRYVISIVYE